MRAGDIGNFDNQTKELKDFYLLKEDVINQSALDLLNKIQYNVIRRNLKNEILAEEVGRK